MPNSRPILTVVVTPGTPCKIELPPCSALEIKQAALSSIEPLPAERCVLECDLASHSFVLCSIIPSGPHQAALGTVITNDPDERAWVFLKARGPRAFHVICQLVVDDSKPDASPAELVVPPGYQRVTRESLLRESTARPELDLSDSGWDLGAPVGSGDVGRPKPSSYLEADDIDREEEGIEVLLPDGDDADVRAGHPSPWHAPTAPQLPRAPSLGVLDAPRTPTLRPGLNPSWISPSSHPCCDPDLDRWSSP